MATCESMTNQNKSQQMEIKLKTYNYALYEDVHLSLPAPSHNNQGETTTIYTSGHFYYFHYGCDGFMDAGWGCGYRTLQTAISWVMHKRQANQAEPMRSNVPSISEIQRMLVDIGDKRERFIGSRDWIGTLEEFYVIDYMFDLPCKILHVEQLNTAQVISEIRSYFEKYAGFIAMGGLTDMASKGIAGMHHSPTSGLYLLIVDPHFVGVPSSKQELIERDYVRWMHISEFQESAYNLCFLLQK